MSLSNDLQHTGNPASTESAWESAYLRFETPEQEIRKFRKRLQQLGALSWPKNSIIVELFCGRGNGLHALRSLGFENLEGVDLSRTLLDQYRGPAKCYVGDCRQLPFTTASKDVIIVQGGLHHLFSIPDDLDQTFAEIRRVLMPEGRALFVEPWLTPFLRFVHVLAENQQLKRSWPKLDALATMIQHERITYEQWLGQKHQIRAVARKHFVPLLEKYSWGKWSFLGKPRS